MEGMDSDEYLPKDGGWITSNLANDIIAEIDANVINDILGLAGAPAQTTATDTRYSAIDNVLKEPFILSFDENIIVANGTIVRHYTITLDGVTNEHFTRLVVTPSEIRMSKISKLVGTHDTQITETPKFKIMKAWKEDDYHSHFNKIMAGIEDQTGTAVGVLFNDKVSYISP